VSDEIPAELAHLPVDARWKLPVPYLVERPGGIPNFGVLDPRRAVTCYTNRLCAMCGLPMGAEVALYGDVASLEPDGFYIEAPVHERCIDIALGGLCPFISRQNYRRRRQDDPQVAVLGDRDHLPLIGREIPKRAPIVAIVQHYQMAMMVTDDGHMPVYLAPVVDRVRRFAWVGGMAVEALPEPAPGRPVTVVRVQRRRTTRRGRT
jgi:hypothetical protein